MHQGIDERAADESRNLLQHALSPRGLVDSALPSIVFVVLLGPLGTSPAAYWSLGVSLLLVVVRLVRRQRLVEALSGVAGVVLAVALSAGTGEAKNYFLPEVVGGLAGAAVAAGSLLVGRPLGGLIIGAVVPSFRQWRTRPLLRGAAVHVTAVAGGWALVKALLLLSLYLADEVGLLGTAKLVLGYPAALLLFAYYARVVKRALALDAVAAA